jgi:DNA-binding NarL/FixJ family response regulator
VLAAADAEADPVLQAEVYELLSRISDDDVVRKLDTARRAAEALDRADDPHPQVVFDVRAALVEAEFFAGLGNHVDRLLGLDPSTRPRFPPLRAATGGDDLIGRLLATSGRVEEGIAVLRALYERAAVASRSTLPAILGWIAEAELQAGRFGEVVALTGEAVERARENGADDAPPWEVGFHAVGLALLGRLDEADAAAARVVGTARPGAEVGIEHGPAVLALGLVASARGRYATALAHLRWIDEAKSRAGIGEPAVCAHVADLIEVLAAAGETAEAYAVLSRFEEQAERTGGGWARAAAARCRALVLAADSRPDAARTAAELAVRLAAALPMPFEQGKAQLMLGQVYRRCRRKREAREALIRALTIFEQLPAPVWAERARGELARIPERHPAEGLTPTEETIARLAAAGLTNREIADRAFISPKTVEVNLTRIYRKLSVRSRAGLAGKVALGESPATRGGNP